MKNLKSLSFEDNLVSDIVLLDKFNKLETLDMGNSYITDIDAIMSLPKLKNLILTGNNVPESQINSLSSSVTVTK